MGISPNRLPAGVKEPTVTTYAGSPNSRYFVGVRDDKLFFTKDDIIIWEKNIPFDVFTLVGVSSNGNVCIHAPEGIYIYDLTGEEVEGPIRRWSRAALAPTSSQLAAVRASADGRTLCLERATLQTRLSQKIFEFLSSNKVQPNTTIHEVFFYDIIERTETSFYRCMASTKSPQHFLWAISPDFTWIVLAEPEKNGSQIRFSVAHVQSKTIYHEFTIPNIKINDLKVSRDGTSLVDVSQNGERAIILVTLDSVKYHLTVPSVDFDIKHLGRDFVAIMTRPTPFLLVKGFDDRLKAQADLRSLERMNVEYDVTFNERDGLDLISVANGVFKVVHTNVEFLETDAKRWEHAADERDAVEEAKTKPPTEPARPKVDRPSRLTIDSSSSTQHPMLGTDGLSKSARSAPAHIEPLGHERAVARALPLSEDTPTALAPPVPRKLPPPPARPSVIDTPARPPAGASPRPSVIAPPLGSPQTPPSRPTVIEPPTRRPDGALPPDETPTITSHSAVSHRPPHETATEPSTQASPPPRSLPPPMPTSGSRKGAAPLPRERSPVPFAADAPPDDAERHRVQRLLELLEERFTLGQVSETTYVELKSKYTARLGQG